MSLDETYMEKRHRMAAYMNSLPVGPDLPGQIHSAGSKVKLLGYLKDRYRWLSDKAIVEYSYGQKYGGEANNYSYSIMVLDGNGNPYTSYAWAGNNELEKINESKSSEEMMGGANDRE